MQIQRAILEKLRANNPLDCADELTNMVNQIRKPVQFINKNIHRLDQNNFLVQKYKITKETISNLDAMSDSERVEAISALRNLTLNAASIDATPTSTCAIHSSEELLSKINSLSEKFDLINSLSVSFIEEMRQNSYDVPKSSRRDTYSIDCWNFVDDCINSRTLLLEAHDLLIDETDSALKQLGIILRSLVHQCKIGLVEGAFADYYPKVVAGKDASYLEANNQEYILSPNERLDTEELPEQEPQSGSKLLEYASQKLLLIRFLQRADLFPKKTAFMDEKQELEFIGELTGLTYAGNLKKVKSSVGEIIDKKLTTAQARHRLKDLQAVYEVAQKMELTKVLSDIEEFKQYCKEIIEA